VHETTSGCIMLVVMTLGQQPYTIVHPSRCDARMLVFWAINNFIDEALWGHPIQDWCCFNSNWMSHTELVYIRYKSSHFQHHNNNTYNTKGATAYPSRAYGFVVGFVLHNYTVFFYKALFVFWFIFLLAIALSVPLQFTFSDNRFLVYSNFLKIICV